MEMKSTYNKLQGAAGSKGSDYQIQLLQFFLLKGYHNKYYYKLSTENQDAGKFDDLVFQTHTTTILLQSKHKSREQKAKINFNQLFPHGNRKHNDTSRNENVKQKILDDGDFNLYKYITKFPETNNNFKDINYLIICTNCNFNMDGINKNINQMLGTNKNYFLTKFEKELPIISSIDNIASYSFDQNQELLTKHVLEHIDISESTVKSFFDKLVLVCIPDDDLSGTIKNIVKTLDIIDEFSDLKSINNFFFNKVKTWFQSLHGTYLTNDHVTQFLCFLRTQNYISPKIPKILKPEMAESMKFYRDIENSKENNIIIKINSKTTFNLYLLTIYQYLLKRLMADKKTMNEENVEDKILLVNPDDPVEIIKKVILSFKIPEIVYLVVPLFDYDILQRLKDTLTNVFRSTKTRLYKRIIIVTVITTFQNEDYEFFENFKILHFNITVGDFSTEFQNKLFISQVTFQCNKKSLIDLANNKLENLNKLIDDYALTQLIYNKDNIILNKNYKKSKENSYYIKRDFTEHKNELYQLLEDLDFKHNKTFNKLSEEEFCSEILKESSNKFIVLLDYPGMGKSTVLDRMNNLLNETTHWVIRINLNELTSNLYNVFKNNIQVATPEEFLNLLEYNLEHGLEQNFFNMPEKVILLIDALDEVGSEYAALILQAISSIAKSINIKKVVITSRPHMLDIIKTKIVGKIYTLEPLSRHNIISFLCTYWKTNLSKKIYNDNVNEYATQLYEKLYNTVGWNEATTLIGIPLQLKIIAEIFMNLLEEGELREHEMNFKENMKPLRYLNIRKIFDMFLENKEKIYIREKCKVDKCNQFVLTAVKNDFKAAINEHVKIALNLLFNGQSIEKLFQISNTPTIPESDSLTKIGILVKTNKNIQFVHRTYAEYFVAKHICYLLLNNPISKDLLKFLIENIFNSVENKALNIFINLMLENTSLPDDLLEQLSYFIRTTEGRCTIGDTQFNLVIMLLPKLGGYEKLFTWEHIDFVNSVHKGAGSDYSGKFTKILELVDDVNVVYKSKVAPYSDMNGTTPLHLCCKFNGKKHVEILLKKQHPINVRQLNSNTPLHFAISRKLIDITQLLLDKGHKIDVKDKDGQTSLHLAVAAQSLEIVQMLLDREHPVNVSSHDGTTPLHIDTSIRITELLLDKGHPVKVSNKYGWTPLHQAVWMDSKETVELLLDRGHPINIGNKIGLTPLQMAVAKDYKEIVSLILDRGVLHLFLYPFCQGTNKNYNQESNEKDAFFLEYLNMSPMHIAVKMNSLELVKLLLDKGFPAKIRDDEFSTPLHVAVSNDLKEVTVLLIERGHPIDSTDNYGQTPLHLAVDNDSVELTKILLDKGHPTNVTDKMGSTPLHTAVSNVSEEMVELLLNSNHPINVSDKDGSTPLHIAVNNDSKKLVDLLLNRGHLLEVHNKQGLTPLHIVTSMDLANTLLNRDHSVNVRDEYGSTPLHYAVSNDNMELVSLLLDKNHPIDVHNDDGFTPLHIAVRNESIEISNLLIERGHPIDVRDKHSLTPLHIAVSENSIKLVNFLLNKNHPINVRNEYGSTPLHIAVGGNFAKMTGFLLGKGHPIDIVDDDGLTPLHFAVANQSAPITNLLILRGHPIDVKNKLGLYPLHIAVSNNSIQLTELLLIKEHPVNVSDINGCTPLHFAAANQSKEIVRLLLEKGHPVNVINKRGQTPMDLVENYDLQLMLAISASKKLF